MHAPKPTEALPLASGPLQASQTTLQDVRSTQHDRQTAEPDFGSLSAANSGATAVMSGSACESCQNPEDGAAILRGSSYDGAVDPSRSVRLNRAATRVATRSLGRANSCNIPR